MATVRARRLEDSPFGRLEGRWGGRGGPCRQAAGEKKGAAEECLQGHGGEFATVFPVFQEGWTGLFFIRCEWESGES